MAFMERRRKNQKIDGTPFRSLCGRGTISSDSLHTLFPRPFPPVVGVMTGELGRDKGNFEYNRDNVRTMFDVVLDQTLCPSSPCMWMNNKRLVHLKKDWSDIINSFYNENS
jgi:hypothetical protein